jgi:hypothetical protein
MSNGVFGTVRPARITSSDVEIFYNYAPSRGETLSDFKGYKRLSSSNLTSVSEENDMPGENIVIDGLYKLNLPLNIFNKKGIYSIYIRPKEYKAVIHDVSVLAAYSDIRGVVFSLTDNLSGLVDLTGYRIEYPNGTTRLIKSCNYCEPVIVNTGDGVSKTTRYNLTDNSSNLVFCTVSPSTAPTFRPNAKPFIGEINMNVMVVNTLFTPQLYVVEMVTHDAETISYMLEGDQANDRDNAIITTYNDKHEIYHQSDYYVLKDKLGKPLYNIRKQREIIDTNQDYNNIIG